MITERIRRNVALAFSALILAVGGLCFATTIEGYTPAGNFQTVFVSADGRLFVEIDSTTPQHVISDTGSVVAIQGQVHTIIDAPNPLPVTATFSGSISVAASTGATITTAQFTLSNSAQHILNASSTRFQSIICNGDTTLVAYVGGAGVNTANGLAIAPGTCLSPDSPASFQGDLYVIATGAGTSNDISLASISP